MKRTESTGLPTFFNLEEDTKKNAPFIELTMMAIPRRVLFPLANILMVAEGARSGCEVYYGNGDSYVVVRESYDEVKRLMEEANR